MGYGSAPQPCATYRAWKGNEPLCGNCAWPEKDHANPTPQTVLAPVLIKSGPEDALYDQIAEKMYGKMPVPPGVNRVPYKRLDANAQNLWFLLAKAAVEALNEMEV